MSLSPRQVELADAALALVSRDGMSAVTFRAVAGESGWSLGAVQKAFASKDQLTAAMFERIRDTAAPLPPGEPGRPTLAAWLVELHLRLLPLDEERRLAYVRAAAFTDRAAFDPAVAAAVAASDRGIVEQLSGLVRRAAAEGEIAPALDPESIGWGFLAHAQGTAGQLLCAPVDESVVRERVTGLVAALLA